MKINSFNQGVMVVNKKKYKRDLIVFPDKIIPVWIRKKPHDVKKKDIQEILDFKPDFLVIGNGKAGAMKVSNSTKELCKKLNIKLIIKKTPKALTSFNKIIKKGEKAVGAFHLTC
jgi:hypothetical protein